MENIKDNAVHLFQILDMFEVVTVAPTAKPANVYGQIKLYVDSLTSPTVFGMWVYFPKVNVWHYFATSTGPSASPSLSPSISPSVSPSKSPSVSPS